MSIVLINAKIKQRKQTEFFQTIESIKGLLKKRCSDFEMECKNNKNVRIKISFDNTIEREENFNGAEFDILKGTLRCLCDDVEIIQDQIKSL